MSEHSKSDNIAPQIAWEGRHLAIAIRDGWEYATRRTGKPAVGILAITDNRRVLMVEQFRPPLGTSVLELPAGLAGDIAGDEEESLLAAAKRELLEETGYTAARWTQLFRGYSSPGLTDESIQLFLAEGLTKVGQGGGEGNEKITLHDVPLDESANWLAARGGVADLKLLAALFAAQNMVTPRGNSQ